MALINPTTKEIHCKLVYYGLTYGGKTSNLQYIYRSLSPNMRSDLLAIPTETERTIFFDCVHPSYEMIYDYTLRVHLYTIPGNVLYRKSKHKVLIGADGVVFVATSDPNFFRENKRDFDELAAILASQDKDLSSFPIVLQFNKRDIPRAVPTNKLNEAINTRNWISFEAIATKGVGVMETFDRICSLVADQIKASRKSRQHS